MPDQTELTNKNQTLSSKKSIQGWEGFKGVMNCEKLNSAAGLSMLLIQIGRQFIVKSCQESNESIWSSLISM